MELLKCMEEFIKRKEAMDEVERNGTEASAEETYEKQFLRLRDISYGYKADGIYTSTEGEKRCNVTKNRYKDIVPYDHSRVKLYDPSNEPGLDYINASYIKGINGNLAYIAAQGPLPDTVVDFWKMLWTNKVKVILMACNEYEGIPRKLRCQRYWAMDSKETLDFDDIVVTLTSEEKTDYEEYKVRHLRVTRGAEWRDVTHLHYVAWPDRGVPKCIPSIVSMIERMRRIQPADQLDAPPVVVHCSAGCGRTGTILVLDYVKNLLKYKRNTERMTKDFSLYSIIAEMRKQRMAIVQSLEQYVFVHEAVVEMFRNELQEMANNADYYNIGPQTSKPPAKSPTPLMSSEYELVDPFDPPLVTAPKKPSLTKPDSLPVVPKPRTSHSSSDISSSFKPEPPRKPSYEKSPSPTGSPVQPNTPRRPSAATERPAIPPQKPESRSPSFSDPDKRPMNDNCYSEVYKTKNGSLKRSPPPMPVNVVIGDSEYAEVGVSDPTIVSSAKFQSKSNAYEYADPNALGKWSLQDVARGVKKPPNNLYASADDYADVDYSGSAGNPYSLVDVGADNRVPASDSDEDAPRPPPKSFAPHASSSSTSSDTVTALPSTKNFLQSIIPGRFQKTVDPDQVAVSLEPAKVFYRSLDISFPNRVPRPNGKRPIKMLMVPAVK